MTIFAHSVSGVLNRATDISMSEPMQVSLEERMIQAYSEASVDVQLEQSDVLAKLQDNRVTSDPAELFKLQQRTSDYNLQLSMISTLTRKGVSAVETLLRS